MGLKISATSSQSWQLTTRNFLGAKLQNKTMTILLASHIEELGTLCPLLEALTVTNNNNWSLCSEMV